MPVNKAAASSPQEQPTEGSSDPPAGRSTSQHGLCTVSTARCPGPRSKQKGGRVGGQGRATSVRSIVCCTINKTWATTEQHTRPVDTMEGRGRAVPFSQWISVMLFVVGQDEEQHPLKACFEVLPERKWLQHITRARGLISGAIMARDIFLHVQTHLFHEADTR